MAQGSRGITPAEAEDLRLIGRAREGDVDAFAGLVMRHRPHVERFLYRLFGDRQKAEDGAQEVFLRLWMARGRYEPRSRFTTFLYQVAQNYWRDQVRKVRARPSEAEWDEEPRGRDDAVVASDLCRAYRPIRAPATTEPHYQLFLRNNTGYHGRTGLFELLTLNEELARLIVEGTPESALRARARDLGVLHPFAADARAKILDGITTAEEVGRVLLEGHSPPSGKG